MRGVNHTITLKLHPYSISPNARESNVELNIGTTVRDERMRMDHVDKVVAGHQHVTPSAQVLFEPVRRAETKMQLRLHSDNRLSWLGTELHLKVLGALGAVVAR